MAQLLAGTRGEIQGTDEVRLKSSSSRSHSSMIFLICSKWHYSRQVSRPYNPAQNRHISQVPVESTIAFEIFVLRHIAVNAPSLSLIRPYRARTSTHSRAERLQKIFRTFSDGTQAALKWHSKRGRSRQILKTGKTGKNRQNVSP